ncbi:hypothetical protein V5O48_016001 [Marasmius crinis-equi]|uniref:Uncharacterized protein n=1 Tax=Marasmius crinis-equi TaxID=585013 RepID=A0ABR3ESX0_9AGAR
MPPGSTSRRYLRSSSSLHRSQHFKGARNFAIGDHSNFSSVRGDQNIYVNAKGKKKRFIVGTEEEEAEYAEFVEIKRGDLVAARTLYRSDDEQWRWMKRVGEQTVVAGKVMIGGASLECTAVSYSGEGAEEVCPRSGLRRPVANRCWKRWKRDFRMFGGARRPENAQLVAINLSTIPMLVLTGDLVPAAHFDVEAQVGMRGLLIGALIRQMGCGPDSLWLDTSRGVFCRGPEGPGCGWLNDAFNSENLPLDAELLQEDVMIRYLFSRKLDRQAVTGFAWVWHPEASQIRVDRPTIISTRTNTILAVGSGRRWESRRSCLDERKEMPDGATRFVLHNRRHQELEGFHWFEADDWLAQALSIFHAHGVPLEGDMREYNHLECALSKAKRRRRRQCPPIYLFIPSFSTITFWSFDPNGQDTIPNNFCAYLGLPIRPSVGCYEYSWETSAYRHLRDYQIARGFDPTTTDFARHNNYRIYDVVAEPLPSRLEEVDNSETTETSSPTTQQDVTGAEHLSEYEDFSLGLLFGDIPGLEGIVAPQPETTPIEIDIPQAITNTSIWSSFSSKFSWAALDDSDIHAAGF